ncbi:MAG: hypothetical protein IJS71_01585 [Clostridia bacterium]|nr:hypothetical protein [Clostridia bacterium]
MKLICNYCDSYVEIGDNCICPCCGAPLGPTVASEKARLQKEAELRRQQEAEAEKERREAAERQQNMQLIGTIVGSVASGLIGYATGSRSNRLRGPGSGVLSKLGSKIFKSIF